MAKKKIALVFGGQSSEHEISCLSAAGILDRIDETKYEIYPLGITRDGRWRLAESREAVRRGSWTESGTEAVLSPDASHRGLIVREGNRSRLIRLDAVFPVLHGRFGEDGTVQGILELARIPYVGCGVLASAVSMDKYYTKLIVGGLGIRQARFIAAEAETPEKAAAVADLAEERFRYPVYIKPCRSGSSRGVSRAECRKELEEGIAKAARHDRKLLIEENIAGREVECAVLDCRGLRGKDGADGEIRVSGVGEVLAGAAFYDYDAKYRSAKSRTDLAPCLPEAAVREIREAARKIFLAVDGYGLARADFFVTDRGEVVFNEINTMPGFTPVSMYPGLWETCGLTGGELIDTLLESALVRYTDGRAGGF